MARIFTYLLVDLPDQPHKVVLWDTVDITVGRGSEQDLVVNDAEVSRQHAIFRLEDECFTIADLHTSNGTFVNGAQVATHQLRPGDSVEVGAATFTFRSETESPMGKGVETCFASQLKGFATELDEGGGRTVLGMAPSEAMGDFEPDADLEGLGPVGEMQLDFDAEAIEPPGDSEALAADLASVGSGADALEFPGLDDDLLELEKEELPPAPEPVVEAFPTNPPAPQPAPAAPPPAPEAAPVRAPEPPPPPATAVPKEAPRTPQPAPAPAPEAAGVERVAAAVALEIEGPRDAVRALLAAVLDRELDLPPLRLRVRRPS